MSDDLIKRQDAMEVLHRIFDAMPLDSDRWLIQDIRSKIADIPSADRPQGEWKNYKDEHYCTNCGEVVIGDWYNEDDWYDFCPNCGARMKGADK